jgi:hypothetical protein
MMKTVFTSLILMLSMLEFSSCETTGRVLMTGFYSGIFLVVSIVGLFIFVIARLSRRK